MAEYVNLLAPTPGGQARLVLVNAAAVGPVDGYLDRFAFRHLTSLRRAPGRAVPAGTHTLRIVKTGTSRTLVGPKRTVLSAGYAYTGFLVGSSRTFALILQADKVGQEGVSELVVDLAMQMQVSVKIHLQIIEENRRVAVKRLHVTAVPRQRTLLRQPATTGKGQRHP